MKYTKIIIGIVLITVITGGYFAVRALNAKNTAQTALELKEPLEIVTTQEKQDTEPEPEPVVETKLPAKYQLKVPFTPQAPFGDWNEPYQEACEEASLLIVHYYKQNKTFIPAIAKDAIDEVIEYEKKYFGNNYTADITARKTADIAKNMWGYTDVEVITKFGIEDIIKEIAAGNPVIVPASGRMLNNPYYTPPGPQYHMLVITGYDSENFITNDPGTKRGENFSYKHDTLMNAIHDWTGDKETVTSGPKAMIVVRN